MGKITLIIQVVIGFSAPLMLQLIGCFSSYWHMENGVNKGLLVQCFTNNTCITESRVLDQATIGLQGTAFVMLLFACISASITIAFYGPDKYGIIYNDDTRWYTCNCCCFYFWVVLYPVAGVLILAGCIHFGLKYPTEVIGWSFYACLTSGCLIFLMIFLASCDQCCKQRRDKNVFQTLLVELYEDAL